MKIFKRLSDFVVKSVNYCLKQLNNFRPFNNLSERKKKLKKILRNYKKKIIEQICSIIFFNFIKKNFYNILNKFKQSYFFNLLVSIWLRFVKFWTKVLDLYRLKKVFFFKKFHNWLLFFRLGVTLKINNVTSNLKNKSQLIRGFFINPIHTTARLLKIFKLTLVNFFHKKLILIIALVIVFFKKKTINEYIQTSADLRNLNLSSHNPNVLSLFIMCSDQAITKLPYISNGILETETSKFKLLKKINKIQFFGIIIIPQHYIFLGVFLTKLNLFTGLCDFLSSKHQKDNIVGFLGTGRVCSFLFPFLLIIRFLFNCLNVILPFANVFNVIVFRILRFFYRWRYSSPLKRKLYF